MKLRDYQLPQVTKLIRQLTNHNEAALVSAVGTGKTLVTSIVGNELRKLGIVSKVIVAAPFNTIVKEFPVYSGETILSGDKNNNQYMITDINQASTIKSISTLISGESSQFLSTSHAAMANARIKTAVNKADDLSGLLLIIDEAHHCFASDDEDTEETKDSTLLGEVANKIKAKGGKVLYVTATPYRTYNGKTSLIFDPELCRPVIRTIGEQMRDDYAPSMETEYIHVKNMKLNNAGDAGIFGDKINTSINDPQLKSALPRVIKQWRSEKYPKTILLIPAGNSEHTAEVVKEYVESIKFPSNVAKTRGRKHPKVLIAVGQGEDKFDVTYTDNNGKICNDLINAIEYDKLKNGTVYDMVIGCRKFDEGTDVSSASHIYMIGLPSSVRLFHQRTGRVLRSKKVIEGYSEWFGDQWMDKAKVVFFAPAGRKTKDFDYKVGRQLLHCIFAAESYQEYCESINASQSVRIAFQKKGDNARCAETKETIDDIMNVLSGIELTEHKDYASNEFNELVSQGLNPDTTFGERIDMINASDMNATERSIAITSLMNHLPNDVKDSLDFDDMVARVIKACKPKKAATFNVLPTEALTDVFEEVLNEFCDVKVFSTTENAVQKVFSKLSGNSFKHWAEKCSQFMGEEHAIKMCNKVIEYTNINGNYPSSSSIDPDIYKLAQWLNKMKSAKNGNTNNQNRYYPSIGKISSDAGYPDMFDIIDHEQNALDTCKQVIDYTNANGKYPNRQSNDPYVAKLGRWIKDRQKAERGNGSCIRYQSVNTLIINAGYPDMFDIIDREQNAIDTCNELIDYIDTNGKYPVHNSKDRAVAKLGKWISKMREAKQGNGRSTFYPSLLPLVEMRGYPKLFDVIDKEQIALDTCKQVIDYIDTNGKYPVYNSKDRAVAKLGKWVTRIRAAKQGKGKHIFYPSINQLVIDAGYPKLFDTINKEQNALDACKQVIDYIDTNGKFPSTGSTNPDIAKLAGWVSKIRGSKQGKGKGTWYPSLQALADKAGLPNLFDSIDKESIALSICKEVIEYYNINHKLPSNNKKNKITARLARWITSERRAKRGLGKHIFYPSLEKLAIESGLPNLFNSNWKDDL
jgi:superfamily II DNA or RNA helicase